MHRRLVKDEKLSDLAAWGVFSNLSKGAFGREIERERAREQHRRREFVVGK